MAVLKRKRQERRARCEFFPRFPELLEGAEMKRFSRVALDSSSFRSSNAQTLRNQGNAGRRRGRPAHSQARVVQIGVPPGGLETGGDSALETVLFVSSDGYFRSMMRAYLEHVGYNVLSCAEPGQALPRFFRVAEIGLVLIDMDALGAAAASLLADQLTESRADLPVILIVGPGASDDTLSQIEQRGWRFQIKPLLLPELLEMIHCALRPRRPAVVEEISRPSPAAKGKPRIDSRRRAASFSLPSSLGGQRMRSVLLKAPVVVP